MGTEKQWKSPPAMAIDNKKKYQATLHTEKGDIVLESIISSSYQGKVITTA
jgi:hypothetical protein